MHGGENGIGIATPPRRTAPEVRGLKHLLYRQGIEARVSFETGKRALPPGISVSQVHTWAATVGSASRSLFIPLHGGLDLNWPAGIPSLMHDR